MTDSKFKQEWQAKKLLKKAKKLAKKNLQKRGLTSKQASSYVKQALNRIQKDEVNG